MCNYGFASMLLSLPQKELCNLGSNTSNQARKVKHKSSSNINTEAKDEVEMHTLVDDSGIFIEASRSMQASPSPRWSPSQGLSSRSSNSVDSLGPSPHASGSPICLLASLSWTAPRYLHYQASGRNIAGLVPSGTWWRPHHKRGWCDLTRP